jgi:hypothetical protein
VFHAVLAKDGTVTDLEVGSGPPALVSAAREAQSMTRVFAEVCHAYPELGGRAKFCATARDGRDPISVKSP